jgi:HEAT repeat protein
VHDLVLRLAILVFAASFVAWCALSTAILVGRLLYDHLHDEVEMDIGGPREARRLIRRAERRARTVRGTWRRIAALDRLVHARDPAMRGLVRASLADPDEKVAAAAVRALANVGDDWAVDLLLDALREGRVPRSRVAAQLEHLAPRPGARLVPLLRDSDPAIRFWGATLLAPYPGLADARLVMMTHDRDPNVRAAAVETLGLRDTESARAAVLAAIDDPVWYVRVHAARSAGHLLGAAAAPSLVRLLADTRWWVRTAAKDALRGIGVDAVPSLLAALTNDDAFARNGAAEVLQDVGFVDSLVAERPDSPLLERIYAAGGERMRDAARERAAAGDKPLREAQAA